MMNTQQQTSNPPLTSRQQWMQVLARAGRQLYVYEDALRDEAAYQLIRPAEVGMVMVRGRVGGSGAPFNLGEMTVSRCVVRTDTGLHGHSYVAGRDKKHAELAALADAHLQGDKQQHWMDHVITPLARQQEQESARREAESAATQVEFVTLVRGEDA